jgi:DUF4097 and DUF4098 domain-containing protein YvlB
MGAMTMLAFQTPDPISAVIEIVAGDVGITAGERTDTTVEVVPADPVRPADVSAAEETRVEYAAGKLLVRRTKRWKSYSPFGEGGIVDVHIGLPAGSRVTGEVALGAFRSSGTLGDCDVKTGMGDISLEHAAGDGALKTGSGDVRIERIDGAATIKNSNGDTHVREAGGDVHIKAANGDVAIDDARSSVEIKTARGDVRIGARRGSVVAGTGLGTIEVAVADGVAAWLDLSTGYGQVHNQLDRAQAPEPGEETVEVRARSGYGDITIRRRKRDNDD